VLLNIEKEGSALKRAPDRHRRRRCEDPNSNLNKRKRTAKKRTEKDGGEGFETSANKGKTEAAYSWKEEERSIQRSILPNPTGQAQGPEV